jgi:hypothetical protein
MPGDACSSRVERGKPRKVRQEITARIGDKDSLTNTRRGFI